MQLPSPGPDHLSIILLPHQCTSVTLADLVMDRLQAPCLGLTPTFLPCLGSYYDRSVQFCTQWVPTRVHTLMLWMTWGSTSPTCYPFTNNGCQWLFSSLCCSQALCQLNQQQVKACILALFPDVSRGHNQPCYIWPLVIAALLPKKIEQKGFQ